MRIVKNPPSPEGVPAVRALESSAADLLSALWATLVEDKPREDEQGQRH